LLRIPLRFTVNDEPAAPTTFAVDLSIPNCAVT